MAEQGALFQAEVVPTNPRQQLVLRRLREAGADGIEAEKDEQLSVLPEWDGTLPVPYGVIPF